MEEVWKPVVGYEGLYQVSNLGRIKSTNYKTHKNEKILKLFKDYKGYLYVCLRKHGKAKFLKVHRLVLFAFMPQTDLFKNQVNHINEIKTDNRLENLEWVTARENNVHGTRCKRVGIANAKNKSKKVIQKTINGEIIKTWNSTREVERVLDFKSSGISKCCNGKIETYKGYKWYYYNEI